MKSVLADGPAAKAGLKAGDHVTQFQGRSVSERRGRAAFRPKSDGRRPGQTDRERAAREPMEINFKTGEGL